MDWNAFLKTLKREINWSATNGESLKVMSEILTEFCSNKQQLVDQLRRFATEDQLLNRYSAHHEHPRRVMDKVVLHIDESEDFRVRLHKFKTISAEGDKPWIHDHRWMFSSYILEGGYEEELYEVINIDIKKNDCNLRKKNKCIHIAGDTNSLIAGIPHKTINFNNTPCYTLFVRGRSEKPYSIIFFENGTRCEPSFGRIREIQKDFEELANILTDSG